MFDDYINWKRTVKNNYEKRRTLQFHALSAIGSIVLGIAAITVTCIQIDAERDREREKVNKENEAREKDEIMQAAEVMTSVD